MKITAVLSLVLSAVLSSVIAVVQFPTQHHLMEKSNAEKIKSTTITHLAKAPAEHHHEVVIAVKHRNLDWLERKLDEVSYPDSPYYGQHMTREEIANMICNPESAKIVREYLESLGFTILRETPYGEFVYVDGTVQQFEQLFATEFHQYRMFNRMSNRDELIIRAEHYSLPTELLEHVEAAFNTVQFPAPIVLGRPHITRISSEEAKATLRGGDGEQPAESFSSSGSLSGTVYPLLIDDYYCVPSNTGNSLTTQTVYESLDQTMSPTDLTEFQNTFDLPVQAIAGDYNGHVNSLTCDVVAQNCTEANLDIQYLMGIAQAVPTYYYYWNSTGSWLQWITAISAESNPQDVYSISYGSYESEVSSSDKTAWNTFAQALGLRGTTIVAAVRKQEEKTI
jgi:tripeptidyl-peptidase-1